MLQISPLDNKSTIKTQLLSSKGQLFRQAGICNKPTFQSQTTVFDSENIIRLTKQFRARAEGAVKKQTNKKKHTIILFPVQDSKKQHFREGFGRLSVQ